MERHLRDKTESRDAIVWDIDESNFLVRCKIQGSNEYILCYYPRNWQTLPPWCKRGNAVRIAHRGGIRGNLEVIGNGRAIPTPIAGADQFPDGPGSSGRRGHRRRGFALFRNDGRGGRYDLSH